MNRVLVLIALALAGCASNAIPPPNTIKAHFEPRENAIQVVVSDVQPMSAAEMLGPDGARFPAQAVSIVSGPHVDYAPPPSVGIGVGGFGFSGCCSGFGSGVGVGFPLGRPTATQVSDQYIASASIPVPADYVQKWGDYRVHLQLGNRPVVVPAPAPG